MKGNHQAALAAAKHKLTFTESQLTQARTERDALQVALRTSRERVAQLTQLLNKYEQAEQAVPVLTEVVHQPESAPDVNEYEDLRDALSDARLRLQLLEEDVRRSLARETKALIDAQNAHAALEDAKDSGKFWLILVVATVLTLGGAVAYLQAYGPLPV